jgi:hypothetical protein
MQLAESLGPLPVPPHVQRRAGDDSATFTSTDGSALPPETRSHQEYRHHHEYAGMRMPEGMGTETSSVGGNLRYFEGRRPPSLHINHQRNEAEHSTDFE